MSAAIKGTSSIAAWQLHRPDLNEGIVYIFRQSDSPYLGIELELRAIDPSATYRVEVKGESYENAETREISGAELKNYVFVLKDKGASSLLRYAKK